MPPRAGLPGHLCPTYQSSTSDGSYLPNLDTVTMLPFANAYLVSTHINSHFS